MWKRVKKACAPHSHKKYRQHGNRTLDIDLYALRSGMAYMNPFFKAAWGGISLVCCLLSAHSLTAAGIGVVMAFLTLRIGRMRWRDYFHMIMIPFSFVLISGMVLLVDVTGFRQGYLDIPVFSFYLSVTPVSLAAAVRVSVKAVSGLLALYMISLSTPLYEIIGVLKKCRVPAIMIELMYFIYRFLFILLDAFYNMNTSARARLGYNGYRRSFQTFFGICSNLLVVAFRKASASFDAMEARCYDGKLVFLEKKKPVTGVQMGTLCLYVTVVILLLAGERFLL